jgi:hypothetical protein
MLENGADADLGQRLSDLRLRSRSRSAGEPGDQASNGVGGEDSSHCWMD